MRSGTKYNCEQGNIVLVPFPFTDLSVKKRRPALIISNNKYNRSNNDFICCGITSNIEDIDCSVLVDFDDLAFGFLPQPSRIKVDKIVTLEQSLIIKAIGKVDSRTIKKVKDELFKLF